MISCLDKYLDELYAHQAWADAEHWRAFEAHSPALADRAIRQRLVHIHQVQHFFLWITGPQTSPLVLKESADFAGVAELKSYAQQANDDLGEIVKNATAEWLDEVIENAWFKPPLKISRRHALMQAALHSHYHRGQNATRLREVGGVPPTTDFIKWLRDGKPAAAWS